MINSAVDGNYRERERRSNKREIEQATLVPYTAAVSLPPTAIFTYRLA
jgi:hypothetical protein